MYGSGGGFAAALMLVAFVAAVVFTVMGYKRYISDGKPIRLNPRDETMWGPFLRFDTLIIDKVLKVLYLFFALLTAFGGVAMIISSLFAGIGAFLAALIIGAIAILAIELLLRIGYELMMLSVIVARNTSEIKRKVCGGEVADADGISSPSPAPTAGYTFQYQDPYAYQQPVQEAAPVYTDAPAPAPAPAPVAIPEPMPEPPSSSAPVPEPVVETVPEPVAAPEAVVEPEPETVVEAVVEAEPVAEPAAPSVCPVCGAVLPEGSKFCSVCGAKVS